VTFGLSLVLGGFGLALLGLLLRVVAVHARRQALRDAQRRERERLDALSPDERGAEEIARLKRQVLHDLAARARASTSADPREDLEEPSIWVLDDGRLTRLPWLGASLARELEPMRLAPVPRPSPRGGGPPTLWSRNVDPPPDDARR